MPRILHGQGELLEKRGKALRTAQKHVRIYLKTLNLLDLVKFRFVGEPMQEPGVVIANHPSLLDFIALLLHYPKAVCLYKSQTLHNPVLADFVQVGGYIEGMDGTRAASERIVSECCERLDEGHTVVIFPEGTRSKASGMLRFRKTGFHAAIETGRAIQPVAIYCRPRFLGKGQPWLDFCKGRNYMVISYLPPISPDSIPESVRNVGGLTQAVRSAIQSELVRLEKTDVAAIPSGRL